MKWPKDTKGSREVEERRDTTPSFKVPFLEKFLVVVVVPEVSQKLKWTKCLLTSC